MRRLSLAARIASPTALKDSGVRRRNTCDYRSTHSDQEEVVRGVLVRWNCANILALVISTDEPT
jgi:hypothetical protein